MKTQPNLSTKILIYLADILPKVGHKFDYAQMQEILEKFYGQPHPLSTLRKEMSLLKKQGFIEYQSRYRKPVPVLSRAGKLRITPYLPFKKFGDWDGKWRIVLFHIPAYDHSSRKIFHETLKNLGFQKIQKGAYISPHPFLPTVRRVANELGIKQYLAIFETSDIDQEQKTISKIWQLDKINIEYAEFIKLARKSAANKSITWPFKAWELEQKFYQTYKKDPHLPKELLPKDWQGEKAYKKYKEIVMSH